MVAVTPMDSRFESRRFMEGRADQRAAPGPGLAALTNKAAMSFSFTEIVLASPLSIKDSRPLRVDGWRIGLAFRASLGHGHRNGFQTWD